MAAPEPAQDGNKVENAHCTSAVPGVELTTVKALLIRMQEALNAMLAPDSERLGQAGREPDRVSRIVATESIAVHNLLLDVAQVSVKSCAECVTVAACYFVFVSLGFCACDALAGLQRGCVVLWTFVCVRLPAHYYSGHGGL